MGDEGRTDTEIELMLSEAIVTSAIEGENLDRDSVRNRTVATDNRLGTRARALGYRSVDGCSFSPFAEVA